ncbi:MAG TPA: hypothetical protein H9915_10850 [Candidatus Gemmiger faecigallinarum]|nr:hypothetical protein [Candidatus Gemmiger faecigallinarum]
MEQTIWIILTAVFAASTAGMAVFLVVVRRASRSPDRTDGRETYVEYKTPEYVGYRGFRLNGLPDSDVLTPTRYWLVDGGVAEVEYSVAHSDDVTLRAAPSGTLTLPLEYSKHEYESVHEFPVGDVNVTLSQSPGRESIFTWTQGGFDFAVFAPGAEMNVMGGLSTEFVTETSGMMKR